MEGLFNNFTFMKRIIFFWLLWLMGMAPTHLKAQGDSVNSRLMNEVRAQSPSDSKGKITRNVLLSMLNFHGALVRKDMRVLAVTTSKELRYQHSNGWVETQAEQFHNLETGYLIYHRFLEDSVVVNIRSSKLATVRFQATIEVSLQGKRNTYHLLVEEDWRRHRGGSNHWSIYARRATKLQ
jgi:hypothetical protein